MTKADKTNGNGSGMRYVAHPTTYAGTRFRSRLEARWAAFFDECGWEWQYEPTDVQGWAPDFNLIGKTIVTPVEVKPIEWTKHIGDTSSIARGRRDLDKVHATKGREVLILGAYPIMAPIGGPFDGPFLGLLFKGQVGDEIDPDGYGLIGDDILVGWDIAVIWGGYDTKFDFSAGWGSYHYRIDGCHDGDHHLINAELLDVKRAWASANAATQWLGR